MRPESREHGDGAHLTLRHAGQGHVGVGHASSARAVTPVEAPWRPRPISACPCDSPSWPGSASAA
eukprot:4587595-Prymnesium_polylepis.2